MRTLEYGTTQHVPAFLTKLWKLVTDTSCDDLISWSVVGTSFIIYDEIRFSKELLPLYFKHNNMASFVRQLNMYGFRKLSCIDQGGMHSYKNEIEFYHQYFIKGQETLLELIKRKIPTSKTDEPKVRQEYINELITNIKSLRGKQDSAEQGLRSLRRENKMLWRHVNLLTDRYANQQAVLQQLLPFFMNMVRTSRTVPLKRKSPLMIDEGEVQDKIARTTSPYFVEHSEHDLSAGLPSSPGNVSNRGPVIHDVTEMEGSKMFADNILCSPNMTKETEVIVDSPLSSSLESSDHTMNSPFSDPGPMETFNILNRTCESSSLSPHLEMARSPANIPNPSLLFPSESSTMPEAASKVPRMSAIPPVFNHDETTSDVPLAQNPTGHLFLPKMENTSSDKGLYSMNCIVNNGEQLAQNRSSAPASFVPNAKPTEPDMSWLLNQSYGLEPNIENWLGQIFKTDNLVAGCSLPQEHAQNVGLP